MLTHVTGDAEPLRVAVNAAVDYVRSFAQPDKQRGPGVRGAGDILIPLDSGIPASIMGHTSHFSGLGPN